MPLNRLRASLAVSVICGCAFAGGLMAKGAASDKAVVAGLLVVIAGASFAALIHYALAWAVSKEN